jgi:hypothetical protein
MITCLKDSNLLLFKSKIKWEKEKLLEIDGMRKVITLYFIFGITVILI